MLSGGLGQVRCVQLREGGDGEGGGVVDWMSGCMAILATAHRTLHYISLQIIQLPIHEQTVI